MDEKEQKIGDIEQKSKEIVNFLFEVGILSKTPRSGFHFLGTGDQSVSEHISRVVFIGYSLSMMENNTEVDLLKVLQMCLFHDIAETRVSDLNYVHQKYVEAKSEKAVEDLCKSLPFGDKIHTILDEYEERKTKESIIAKDADNLEWIISLKEQFDIGNTRAREWIDSAIKRLKTDNARKIAEDILKTESTSWWFGNKEDKWWVNRNQDEK
ncbi:MAG: HD domain-containing protein [Candidatus Nanoarchaeia archaeon]|nr:HD domain-containing protein [Candidatus Nanoarchaeia archaeon]